MPLGPTSALMRSRASVSMPPAFSPSARGANDRDPLIIHLLILGLRASTVVPGRDHRRELSELLDVVPPLHASTLLSACLGRTDQRRPKMRLTHNHVPGTDVRPHLRSIRLLASLNRNSTRSASLP